ncbi:MAG: hypothetical protein ACYCXX_07260 [Acidiferrobacter thiooxydans]
MTELTDLDDFLKQNVNGYLFADLEAMKAITLKPGEVVGAVGYPLLMATFAGIELLGTLVSTSPFSDKDGRRYFSSFWTEYLYKDAPQRDMGEPVYELARHGLMHLYAVKCNITVTKGEPDKHLRQDKSNNVIYIDSVQLADDLMSSYTNHVRPLLTKTDGSTMAQRLTEMRKWYAEKTKEPVESWSKTLPYYVIPLLTVPQSGKCSTESPASSGSALPLKK